MRSLPFVEAESVRPSLASRQVAFRLKPGQSFDQTVARKALGDAGYDEIELVSRPKGP